MNSSVKNSAFYLFQIVFSGILSLILLPLISRYLNPIELGQFILTQVYSVIMVGIANFGMLLSYERNFFIYEKSIKDSGRLFYSALIFVLFNLSILFLIVWFFRIQIKTLILSDSVDSDLVIIVLVGSIFSSLSQFYLTFLKNSKFAKSYAKFLIANSIIYFSLAIFLMVQIGLGVLSLAYSWMVSNLLLFTLLVLRLKKRLPLGFDFQMLKEMFKISWPLTPRILFGFLNTQLDKILLGMIGSSGLVGIYYVGQTFASVIFQFMTALDRVFQPELYRKLFANKHFNNSREISDYIFPFFYFSVFIALIVILFSKEIVFYFLQMNIKILH